MLPKEFAYPEFVANQVLQSSHLNDSFEYLDEQNRLTRTNLIGIGVVCGLDVVPIGTTQIKITKGCGITSEGYLITFGEKNGLLSDMTFSSAKTYNVPERLQYLPFYDAVSKTNKFEIWELLENTAAPNPLPTGFRLLDTNFLNPTNNNDKKVIILFVELLENINKNCSPNSCDDKGANIKVTFRPLLIKKVDADKLLADASQLGGNKLIGDAASLLPDMKMPRFDVSKTDIAIAADLVDAYRKILTKQQVELIKENLTLSYNIFSPLLGFPSVISSFNPTYNLDKVELDEVYEYQYFYDFLSDLIEVYKEIQIIADEIFPICCPDERLFPRHLFLGLASQNTSTVKSNYRHFFTPSPLLNDGKNLHVKLKSLFQKLMEMLRTSVFDVPKPSNLNQNSPVRITPSMLGNIPISEKAIPYYYKVNDGSKPLYQYWNYEKTKIGKANHNLTYNPSYAPSSLDFVKNPLKYDLEPYNFLRIEGHVGLDFRTAMKHIIDIRETNRLPFDVVAIQTGRVSANSIDISEHDCYFKDLEISYDIARREWECCIGKTIEYLDDNFLDGDIQAIGSSIYNKLKKSFIRKLVISKKYMVNDLPQFVKKYTDFLSIFEEIEAEATDIRTDLDKLNQGNRDKNPAFVEDLIDHLDDVVMSCMKGPFRALYQEFMKRFALLREQLSLKYYANNHVGLQHKAGVPMSGTFVVIYKGRELKEEKFSGEVIADFYLPYLCCSDCCGGQTIILAPETPNPKPENPNIDIIKAGCKEDIYQVEIKIDRGKKPYEIYKDGAVLLSDYYDNSFTDQFSNSNLNAVEYKVVESGGGKSNVVRVTPEKCCPCDTLDCEYLFIEPPKEKYFVEVSLIDFIHDDTISKITLSNQNLKLLGASVTAIDFRNFKEQITKIINEFIKSNNRNDKIEFNPSTNDKFSTISIKHFECHSFRIKLQFIIDNQTFILIYTENGVTINEVFVPKFNCVKSNECKGIKEEQLCKEEIKIKDIKVIRNTDGSHTFSLDQIFNDANYYWKFEILNPALNAQNLAFSTLLNPKIVFDKRSESVNLMVWVIKNACVGFLKIEKLKI